MVDFSPEDETTVRQRRVAELVAEEMSLILQDEVDDPRLSGAQVTGARVSRDLRQATVYVAMADAEHRAGLLVALEHCTPFLRRQLAARAFLRFVPELRFRLDDTDERARRIESLLDQVVPKDTPADEPSAAGK